MLFLVQEQLKKETGSEDILSLSFGRIEIVSHYLKKKKKSIKKKEMEGETILSSWCNWEFPVLSVHE